MHDFVVTQRFADGVYGVYTDGHRAMWARRKLRKANCCAATQQPLDKGAQHYGPIGNQMYRARRLHRDFVEGRTPIREGTGL